MAVEKIEKIIDIKVEGLDQIEDLKENINSASESTSSVKGLKAQISELRDTLVGLEKGSEDYKATVEELIEKEVKLKEVMSAGKNEINAAEGSYNALSQRMSALKNVWKETTDEATRNEIGAQINDLNNQLKAMDASTGNFQRNVGNYKSAVEGLTKEFANQSAELKNLKTAMEDMDPASEEYAEAMKRASEITHNLQEQQENIRYSSADLGDQLSNIRGIATNLAAGYSALNAAIGLFGEENEDLQKAMLKVQQSIALVQGMEGLDGFIKKTQGLSTAMKTWIANSKASAAASKASAAASSQDAAAKTAEAAATGGAVAPQLALNAAMEANPIGFIIGLIAALVAAFVLLKDKINDLIGGNEKLSKAFEKVKVIAAGVGNVIKKSVVDPIKLAIVPLKTFGKVLMDVFTLNWSEIKKDLKDGVEESAEIVKDYVNVTSAYKEGANEKQAKLDEADRKKEAEARKKELDDYIKDMEAKSDADWKYTEEGRKAYDEYFKYLIDSYKEGTEEYKEALRDRDAYDKEYRNKQKKYEDEANKKKAVENNKKLESFKSKFKQYVPELDQISFVIQDMEGIWSEGIELYEKELIEVYKKTKEEAGKIRDEMFNSVMNGIDESIVKQLNESVSKQLYDIDRNIDAFVEKTNQNIEAKKITLGIKIPDEELNAINDVFEKQIAGIISEIDIVEQKIKTANDKGLSSEDNKEYEKLLDKRTELQSKLTKVTIDNIKTISDVWKAEYEKELENITNDYEERKRLLEGYFEWENTERENNAAKSLGFVPENQLNALKDQKAYYEDYYNYLIDSYQEQRDKYISMSTDMRLTAEERENAEKEAEEMLIQIRQANHDKAVAMAKNETDMYKLLADSIKSSFDSISSTLSSLADSWSSMIELERTEIAQQLENNEISEDQAKQREEQNKASFENMKKLQIAQATINALAAAVSAYQSVASIPYVGPVLGAAAAAAALAAGYAQIKQIEATQYGGNSGSLTKPSSSNNINYNLPNVMDLEPEIGKNYTNASDTDSLNNNGNGGKGEPIECYVVESQISAKQELAKRRRKESTF